MAKVRSPKLGSFVIVGFAQVRYRTLAQARKYLYGGQNIHGKGSSIAHVVEDYQELEGDARPYLETPKTRIRRLVHSKLDPLYAKRKAWTTKLRRAETALRRLKRRIAWYESHTGS
jgi:hypothetical protein